MSDGGWNFKIGAEDAAFLEAVAAEVKRARRKFPNPSGLLAALTEEGGEVAKALLDEPGANVYAEAVQVAAMACRLAVEGDPTLDLIRVKRGLDTTAADGWLRSDQPPSKGSRRWGVLDQEKA